MNEKLKKRQEAKKAGCSFMNDRDKGEFVNLECTTVTLVDAYKIRKDDAEFWAFIVEEEPQEFYFANAGLASILDDAADIAADEEVTISEVLKGTKVYIGALVKGQHGRSYRPVDIVD